MRSIDFDLASKAVYLDKYYKDSIMHRHIVMRVAPNLELPLNWTRKEVGVLSVHWIYPMVWASEARHFHPLLIIQYNLGIPRARHAGIDMSSVG